MFESMSSTERLRRLAERWSSWSGPAGDQERYKGMAIAITQALDSLTELTELRAKLAAATERAEKESREASRLRDLNWKIQNELDVAQQAVEAWVKRGDYWLQERQELIERAEKAERERDEAREWEKRPVEQTAFAPLFFALEARAEAAEARANSFYRTFLETIRAFGGVAKDGLSDAFIQIGVPAEAAAVVKQMKEAEAERDVLRRRAERAEHISDECAYQNAALRTALEEIAAKPSCGCMPICRCNEPAALAAELEEKKELAKAARALTPPDALDELRRRERSIGAEEELRRIADLIETEALDERFAALFCADLLDRADAIAAERAGEGGAA